MKSLRDIMRDSEAFGIAWRIHLVGIGICVGLSALVYAIGVQPLLGQHERYVKQEAQLAARRKQAGEAAASLAAVKSQLGALNEALAASPLQLQPAEVMNQRLALLTDLAGKSGLRLDTIEPGRPVSGLRFDALPIQLTGGGAYRDCAVFIRRMRQMFPDTGVGSLELTGAPPDAGGAMVPARFDVNLIWYTAAEKPMVK